jgi:hypothetical protein
MVTGKLYVDGNDAWVGYRVFVAAGGYDDLLGFASLKPVESNVWAEDDGAEFDLSSPVPDSRGLSVGFAFHGVDAMFGAFVAMLSDMAYHTFNFAEIGRRYRLRLVEHPGFHVAGNMGVFTLRFADDFPLEGYTYSDPVSDVSVPRQGYELDGKDLSEYGVYVLSGSEAEILKSPAVKLNLLTDIRASSGAIYDGRRVNFQTKDVKLNCLMLANTLSGLWRNYDALLYNLIRPNERVLYVDSTGCEYPCFYKGCSVEKFASTGKIWLQFALTLTFTSFRVEGEEFLLASEDGGLIVTEDGDYAIGLF